MTVPDSTVAEQARAWVDSIRDRWRLQILSRRVRVGNDGKKSAVPTRIRRFVEGVPWAFVKPAIDYLVSQAPYDGIIANGTDFGTSYRPTLTIWQRDAQSAATGAVRQDATYTLVQDLVEAGPGDVYVLGSSSSCSESVETEYVWDAGEVGELPRGEQGVTYAIAAVRRGEDGSYDYQLVKRRALTQHVEETIVRDDRQARVTQESWDNVYGPVDGSYVDHDGNVLDVPAVGTVETEVEGVTVRTSARIEGLSENPDCTLKFQVVRETTKDAGSGLSCKKTAFEHEHGTVTPGQGSVPDHVDEASDGHYEEIEGRLQPDGSYVVTRKATDEISEDDAGLDIRKTTRAVVTTVTRRNVPTRASEPARPGGREVHEMTPGKRYNLTVTTAEPNAEPDSARCSATVFEHVHDDVTMQSDLDSESFVPGGGRYGEIVQDMDEYGVVKKVVRTTYETPQPLAGRDVRVTTRAKIVTTTSRNVDDVCDSSDSGSDSGSDDLGNEPRRPGERRVVEMTPGGKYNISVTTVTPNAMPDSARCSNTAFEHVHDEVTMESDVSSSESAAWGNGTYQEIVQDMDEYGVVKKVVRTTDERTQVEAAIEKHKYLDATVTRVTERNLKDVTVSAAVQEKAARLKVGESVTCELTTGGAVNRVTVGVDKDDDPRKLAESCRKTNFVHTHSSTRNVGEASSDDMVESVEHVFEQGHIRTRSVRLTERGTWEETSESQDASSDEAHMVWISTSRTLRTVNVHLKGKYVYRNWDPRNNVSRAEGVYRLPPVPKRVNLRTEGLVWKKRFVTVESSEDSAGYVSFRERERFESFDGSLSFEDVSAELSINDFKLYDVIFTCSSLLDAYEAPGGGRGSGGPSEQGDEHQEIVTYRYRTNSKGKLEEKMITAHVRYLWSTTDNMRRSIIHGKSRPDLGMVSHYESGMACAVIYTRIDDSAPWRIVPDATATTNSSSSSSGGS